MNLKERIGVIDRIKNVSSLSDIEIKRDFDEADIFVKNSTAEQIIKNAVNKEKNIIILCPSYVDKTIAANYIRNFLDVSIPVEILRNISDNLPFVSAEKVIVPEPSVAEIIKIFELILCDYKTFIFAMNLKTFENALESLRTLIALNSPNLSSNNVEHLIGITSAVLIYVDRTDDGLFNVIDIGKIVYKNNTAFLDILYSSNNIAKDEFDKTPAVVEKQIREKPIIEKPAVHEVSQTVNEKLEKSKELPSEKVEKAVEKDLHKVNKYKLLKEKIRSKKV